MKAILDKLFSRAFGKMLYRIALVLLGLPTMVVAFLAFLTTRSREDEEYKRYRAKAKKEAEKDGDLLRAVTEPMPVSAMHEAAAKLRQAGAEVFFAAMGE